MKTILIDFDSAINPSTDFHNAAQCLREGGLVAFPTETVYGLGANALDESAVKRIYTAKGRESDNPLIVHIYDRKQLNELVRDIPDFAVSLMDAYWPGPLTLVMRKLPVVPDCVTGGLDTVGIRFPANNIACKLMELADVPVAAPSANTSGKPSPTLASEVMNDLDTRIDYVIDGGRSAVGLESTVLDVTVFPPVILRPGGITPQMVKDVVGDVRIHSSLLKKGTLPKPDVKSSAGVAGASDTASAPNIACSEIDSVPKSPGMKYKHYAPDAPMSTYIGSPARVISRICKDVGKALSHSNSGRNNGSNSQNKIIKIGILAREASIPFFTCMFSAASLGECVIVRPLRQTNNGIETSMLFSSLREFDQLGVDQIFCEYDEEIMTVEHSQTPDATLSDSIAFAESNRLGRASSFHMIQCGDTTAEPMGDSHAGDCFSITFVCTGNTCRSCMAEYLARAAFQNSTLSNCTFTSCGLSAFTGDQPSANAVTALSEDYSIDLSDHRARTASPYIFENSDLILTMGNGHLQTILGAMPELAGSCCELQRLAALQPQPTQSIDSRHSRYSRHSKHSMHGFDISDPYGGDMVTYKVCAQQLSGCIDHLLNVLMALLT